MSELPYFGFSGTEDALGFGDINNPEVGGIFNTITPPVDHIERGLSRLPYQFFDSVNLRHFVQVFLEEIQEIEEVIYRIKQQQSLEFAVGVQLDGIADDVGIMRNGITNDNAFRNRVATKILVNSSEGKSSTVLQAWSTLLQSTAVELYEEFPAGIILYSPKAIEDPTIIDLVEKTIPITVRLSVLSARYENIPPFCFEGGIGAGFGTEEDGDIGGQFVGRYEP